MSFTGDLEHLPIVDIVQLLHAARKSGNLLVSGTTESRLVFQEGRVVSAIHPQSGARLRRLLRESKGLDGDALAQMQRALRPGTGLVAGLLQQKMLNEEQALGILEKLVQTNLVEMLSWQQGTFSLDVDSVSIADEFRFLGEAIGQPVRFDTQGLLMDALRIFDEKQRDGVLEEESFAEEEMELAAVTAPGSALDLSLEDLGLDGIDRIERKIPDVFTTLNDPTPIDPRRLHFQELASGLTPEQIDALWQAVSAFPEAAAGRPAAANPRNLLFYSADALVSHCLTVVCKGNGVPVFTTTDAADVEPILAQSLGKGLLPLLVIDVLDDGEGEFTPQRLAELRRHLHTTYPQLPIIEWRSSIDLASYLQAYRDGARAVFARPALGSAAFVPQLLLLLEAFLTFARSGVGAAAGGHLAKLQSSVREILQHTEIPEIADVLLRFIADFCPRSLVFVVAQQGLIAGRSSGIVAEADPSSLRLQIPLDETSSLRQVLEEGRAVLASQGDGLLRRYLYPLIGAPAAPVVLLLPLLCRGRKIALLYGDFGQQPLVPVPLELLEILTSQAALQIEVALYRKKLEK
jgi:hypothetical protein